MIFSLYGDLPQDYRSVLQRIPGNPRASADAAACLLGLDLWRGPLVAYRDYLRATGERPHLWSFAFGPSGAWDASRWSALPLSARLVRARAGSLDRTLFARPTAWNLDMKASQFRDGCNRLLKSGLAKRRANDAYEFEPLTTRDALHLDLSLVEIIVHWFWRLSDRDRALGDPYPSGFEVHGYGECCALCRSHWGLRERDPQRIPPFHPGCRCFAQPRFA